jgi:D-glutamate cyclase
LCMRCTDTIRWSVFTVDAQVGMGKVRGLIIARNAVPLAAQVTSTLATDYLIVGGVTNWGCYALAGALAVVTCDTEASLSSAASRTAAVARFLPTEAHETALLERLVAAGARDGVTGESALTVDGMPHSVSMAVLREVRAVVAGSAQPASDGVVSC